MPGQFGAYLKRLRKDAGLSLKELSEKTSCPVSSLSDYEMGKRVPPEPVMRSLSKVLSVPFERIKGHLVHAEMTELLRADPYLSEHSKREIEDFIRWARERDREETQRQRRGE